MFFIALTRNPIAESFQGVEYSISLSNIDSLIATIITDGFMSRYFTEASGFSIIESPFVTSKDVKDIVLSEVTYDKKENRLLVVKPTLSGRPIYYHLNSRGEFFCSTHISMFRRAGVPIEENEDVLPEFFVYRYITPPNTMFHGINQLFFGSEVHVSLNDNRCTIDSEIKFNPLNVDSGNRLSSSSEEEAVAKISADIVNSVNQLSPASDRIAVLLSGGFDSSILYAICKDSFGTRDSYSTSYPFLDPGSDRERDYALSAAEAFGADHHFYETTTEDYLYGILESILIAEEPVDHLQTPLYHLLFKNGIPTEKDIAVTGHAADGLFGPPLLFNILRWNQHKTLYRLLSRRGPRSLIEEVSSRTERGYGFVKRINLASHLDRNLDDPENAIYSLGAYGSKEWVRSYFGVEKWEIVKNRYGAIKQYEQYSLFDAIAMLNTFGGLAVTQTITSKLGEEANKILYYPYDSSDIFYDAFSISWETKLREFKMILRGVATDLNVPRFIIERRKSGFGVTARKWALKGGVFDPLIPLASKSFDKKIILEVQSQVPESAMIFWNILNYSIWKRLLIDNEPLENLREELSRNIADQGS